MLCVAPATGERLLLCGSGTLTSPLVVAVEQNVVVLLVVLRSCRGGRRRGVRCRSGRRRRRARAHAPKVAGAPRAHAPKLARALRRGGA
eukprot:gene18865-biopygen8426